MTYQPKFPNSRTKAPNVFIGVDDGSGNGRGPGDIVPINIPAKKHTSKFFTSVLYPVPDGDFLDLALPTLADGSLLHVIPTNFTPLVVDSLNIGIPSITGELIQVIIPAYFTSVLYPVLVQDTLNVSLPLPTNPKNLLLMPTILDSLNIGLPTITGALTAVIVYKTYAWGLDNVSVGLPSLASGALTSTIAYKSYSYGNDNVSVGLPSLAGGNIATVINYISYNNWAAENIAVGLPSIAGGSLI